MAVASEIVSVLAGLGWSFERRFVPEKTDVKATEKGLKSDTQPTEK